MPEANVNSKPPSGKRRSAAVLCVSALAAAFLVLYLPGIRWGLPSEKRNALYYTTGESEAEAKWPIWYHLRRQWQYEEAPWDKRLPGRLPRSVYNPVRSYHPDEYMILKMLSRMRPWTLDVDPKWYVIGGGYVYPLGAVLKACDTVGLITLRQNVVFYIANPGEIARLYLVGRVLSVFLAAAAIVMTGLVASQMWGRTAGVVAALMLMLSPLFLMHSHFMYNDVPGTFWVTLTMLASAGILKKGLRRYYVLAGVAAGLAAGTKLFHGFAILLPLAAHIFCRRDEAEAKPRRRRVTLLVEMLLIAAAAVLVTNPYYVVRFGDVAGNFGRHMMRGTSFGFYLRSWSFGFGVLPLVAALVGLVAAAVKRDRFPLIVGLWCAAYYVFLSIFGKQFARYLMPALPAAAMLCGYLFHVVRPPRREGAIEGQDRTSRRQKGTSKRIWAIFCVIVVISAPQIATQCDIILTMRRPDSRTEAGRAILRELRAGATVAVTEEPWQFEMPPMDQRRYEVIVVGYDVEDLKRAWANAFVFSDLQSDPEINPHPQFPNEGAFWREVLAQINSGAWRVLYETPSHMRGPKFWSGLWLWKKPPEDLRYVCPRVTVVRLR